MPVSTDYLPQVTVSQRVEGTPAVIVASAYGYSANMERIIKAQTLQDTKQIGLMSGQRSMEINPRHPIVHELNKKVGLWLLLWIGPPS